LVKVGGKGRRGEPKGETTFCFAFGLWKYGFVRAYLAASGLDARFCLSARHARLRGFGPGARVVVWGMRDKPDVRALANRYGASIWRMEDGFLRSVGLGSDFNIPASLVLDRTGIYFDPSRPSDLETVLQNERFDAAELARAGALRATIVARALTKYNFAGRTASLTRPAQKRVILVPGQVEDDASIRLGCRDIRDNLSLLREVRTKNPDAFVMFKPHPDLLAGNREEGRVDLGQLRALCDRLILDEPLPSCLAIADEVHTMTSLVGFEALLRGLIVHTYGSPFYSGWGLTQDRHRVERRTRTLSLDELVAGVLLRYPLYMSRAHWQLTTPEGVIAELLEELEKVPAQGRVFPGSARVHRFERKARKLLHAVRGIVRGA
jgi:capsular polysaccharide export protein